MSNPGENENPNDVQPAQGDAIIDSLTPLGVTPEMIGKIKSDLGVSTVEDLGLLKTEDLTAIGMAIIPARKLIQAFAPTVVTPAATPPSPFGRMSTSSVRLEEIPSPANWLSTLSTVQPMRIPPAIVVTGIKAGMADLFGYFQLPKAMKEMLQEAAEEAGESVPDLYFELNDLTLARRYGELIPWMKGKHAACSVPERNRFLQKLHAQFWDAIEVFYNELDAWRKGRRDSQDVGEALQAAMSGELQMYDATQVRSAALAFGNTINKIFSGTGVYAATALSLDNDKLQDVLGRVDYRQFGVQSREQLMNRLQCAVSPEIIAAESSISKFVWNAVLIKDRPAGDLDEQRFLVELAAAGASRPWTQIKALLQNPAKKSKTSSLSGIGSGRRRRDEEDELDS